MCFAFKSTCIVLPLAFSHPRVCDNHNLLRLDISYPSPNLSLKMELFLIEILTFTRQVAIAMVFPSRDPSLPSFFFFRFTAPPWKRALFHLIMGLKG